jgi:hypothetical protein
LSKLPAKAHVIPALIFKFSTTTKSQMTSMKSVIRILCAIAVVVVMSGCATSLDKKATAIDWTKGSVVVMSVEMTNQSKPDYQPTGMGVMLKKKSGSETRESIPAFSQIPTSGNTFLVTQQIQPGRYTISKIYGFSRKTLIMGGIDFAVDAPFEVAPNSVVYLGRVSAINKEKTDKNDQSTGGVIPLIDQAVSGFGPGTLAVSLGDNYAEDVMALKQDYASMQNVEVVRNPLKTMTLERTTGSKAAPIVVKYLAAKTAAVDKAQAGMPILETQNTAK